MHRYYKIFVYIHLIKLYHGATLIGLFLKYFNKYLYVQIWLNASEKNITVLQCQYTQIKIK
jgi:hypothetical protein